MNWSKVTLKQFHRLADLDKSDLEPIPKAIERLKALNITPDDSSLGNLLAQIPEFLNQLPTDQVQKEYKIGGKTFIPHIDFTAIKTGRFLDIYNQIKDKDAQDVREWPFLLALCLSETGEPYDYKTHMDRAEWLYENMTFDQVYPIMVFFSKVWTLLQEIILDSSMDKLRIQLKELMQIYNEGISNSQSIGDGSVTSQK